MSQFNLWSSHLAPRLLRLLLFYGLDMRQLLRVPFVLVATRDGCAGTESERTENGQTISSCVLLLPVLFPDILTRSRTVGINLRTKSGGWMASFCNGRQRQTDNWLHLTEKRVEWEAAAGRATDGASYSFIRPL